MQKQHFPGSSPPQKTQAVQLLVRLDMGHQSKGEALLESQKIKTNHPFHLSSYLRSLSLDSEVVGPVTFRQSCFRELQSRMTSADCRQRVDLCPPDLQPTSLGLGVARANALYQTVLHTVRSMQRSPANVILWRGNIENAVCRGPTLVEVPR